VNDKVTVPPLAIAVPAGVLVPSPQLTVPLNESLAGAVQPNVAVTLWPACTKVGVTLKVQFGFGGGCEPTISISVDDMLARKFASPPYMAVIECDPTERAAVVNVAFWPLSIPVPIGVVPSMNVTVPVGVPPPGKTGLTVAVNVTDCPNTEGFSDDVMVVAVPWIPTISLGVAMLCAGPPRSGLIHTSEPVGLYA
jgi:hypothetical protein